MMKRKRFWPLIPINMIILLVIIVFASGGSKVVSVIAENASVQPKRYIIIDAGHGGEDGGATSVTGKMEKDINLEISLRLKDVMNLLGMRTIMIRSDDCSVFKEGNTIAARKVSDLKERVKIANQTDNAMMISIHQNYFAQNQYKGPQVFYSGTRGSKELAHILQKELVNSLDPTSRRSVKKADGIYLMENVKCTAVLIECGFLSNPEEEKLLCDGAYQRKLCSVIAASLSQYLTDSLS